MTISEFEKFVVRKPILPADRLAVKGRQSPPMVLMSSAQVPEADVYAELGWVYGIPEGGRQAAQQVYGYDQILLHIGMDYSTPQVLGATVEMPLGGQSIVFNTTTAVFIPKGTPFGPVTWKEFHRPHIQMSIMLGSGDPFRSSDGSDLHKVAGALPNQTRGFDFEQYVVRSPMREAGPDHVVTGRQIPSMTYMSRTQVNIANNYLEFGWIWDVPSDPIPKMRHDNYGELVVHFGNDPDNPEDLGVTMQFGIGDDPLEFDTIHCAYIPKGLDHGPLVWKEVRRPMIEMALMLGAGIWAEGWEGSFFDEDL
jgi:hypothetical protein